MNTEEALLAHLTLTSCCVAQILTGHGLVLVWGLETLDIDDNVIFIRKFLLLSQSRCILFIFLAILHRVKHHEQCLIVTVRLEILLLSLVMVKKKCYLSPLSIMLIVCFLSILSVKFRQLSLFLV